MSAASAHPCARTLQLATSRSAHPFAGLTERAGRQWLLRLAGVPQAREPAQRVEPERCTERDRCDGQEPASEIVEQPVEAVRLAHETRVTALGRPPERHPELLHVLD